MTDSNAYDLCYIKKVMENLICAPCRQAIWHTYCILIFGTYKFHIWVSSQTNMTYMCATWLCHMIVIWETHMCYILSTYLTQIWLMQMHMTFATLKSYGKSHMCPISPSYLTHILHSHIRHIYSSHMDVRPTWHYNMCHVTLLYESHVKRNFSDTDMTHENANGRATWK